jgi:hypothetical protein
VWLAFSPHGTYLAVGTPEGVTICSLSGGESLSVSGQAFEWLGDEERFAIQDWDRVAVWTPLPWQRWEEPNIIVSPHAAGGRPIGAATRIAENLAALRTGAPLTHVVSR